MQYFHAFEKLIPWIALGLLGFIGGKMLYESLANKCEECDACAVGLTALLVQGVATSIDALSVGFTIADHNLPEALVAAAVIALVTLPSSSTVPVAQITPDADLLMNRFLISS